ncbi:ecdysteroid UDP-glucosyltransferase [Elysia marginata]|uniref:Ecdysteroid UDP-glucosyltransferase n=1 Tax=Elysia marginata TaxID=1093978 RepID=A0AAV4HZH7_9GAST|nr:ecdysteroid UDP-glucosyltransferase [Elysia marginata]
MGEGRRRRGRPCMRWKDDIKTVTGLTLSELVRVVENRDYWRQLITTITRSQPRLDGPRNQEAKSRKFSLALCMEWECESFYSRYSLPVGK